MADVENNSKMSMSASPGADGKITIDANLNANISVEQPVRSIKDEEATRNANASKKDAQPTNGTKVKGSLSESLAALNKTLSTLNANVSKMSGSSGSENESPAGLDREAMKNAMVETILDKNFPRQLAVAFNKIDALSGLSENKEAIDESTQSNSYNVSDSSKAETVSAAKAESKETPSINVAVDGKDIDNSVVLNKIADSLDSLGGSNENVVAVDNTLKEVDKAYSNELENRVENLNTNTGDKEIDSANAELKKEYKEQAEARSESKETVNDIESLVGETATSSTTIANDAEANAINEFILKEIEPGIKIDDIEVSKIIQESVAIARQTLKELEDIAGKSADEKETENLEDTASIEAAKKPETIEVAETGVAEAEAVAEPPLEKNKVNKFKPETEETTAETVEKSDLHMTQDKLINDSMDPFDTTVVKQESFEMSEDTSAKATKTTPSTGIVGVGRGESLSGKEREIHEQKPLKAQPSKEGGLFKVVTTIKNLLTSVPLIARVLLRKPSLKSTKEIESLRQTDKYTKIADKSVNEKILKSTDKKTADKSNVSNEKVVKDSKKSSVKTSADKRSVETTRISAFKMKQTMERESTPAKKDQVRIMQGTKSKFAFMASLLAILATIKNELLLARFERRMSAEATAKEKRYEAQFGKGKSKSKTSSEEPNSSFFGKISAAFKKMFASLGNFFDKLSKKLFSKRTALIAGILAFIGGIIYYLYKHPELRKQICDWMKNIFGIAKEFFKNVWANVPPEIREPIEKVVTKIMGFFSGVKEFFASLIDEWWPKIKEGFETAINIIKKVIKIAAIVFLILNPGIAIVIGFVMVVIKIFKVIRAIKTALQKIFGWIFDFLGGVFGKIKEFMHKTIEAIKHPIDTAKKVGKKIGSAVSGWFTGKGKEKAEPQPASIQPPGAIAGAAAEHDFNFEHESKEQNVSSEVSTANLDFSKSSNVEMQVNSLKIDSFSKEESNINKQLASLSNTYSKNYTMISSNASKIADALKSINSNLDSVLKTIKPVEKQNKKLIEDMKKATSNIKVKVENSKSLEGLVSSGNQRMSRLSIAVRAIAGMVNGIRNEIRPIAEAVSKFAVRFKEGIVWLSEQLKPSVISSNAKNFIFNRNTGGSSISSRAKTNVSNAIKRVGSIFTFNPRSDSNISNLDSNIDSDTFNINGAKIRTSTFRSLFGSNDRSSRFAVSNTFGQIGLPSITGLFGSKSYGGFKNEPLAAEANTQSLSAKSFVVIKQPEPQSIDKFQKANISVNVSAAKIGAIADKTMIDVRNSTAFQAVSENISSYAEKAKTTAENTANIIKERTESEREYLTKMTELNLNQLPGKIVEGITEFAKKNDIAIKIKDDRTLLSFDTDYNSDQKAQLQKQ